MVFPIQNRDARATHFKADELIWSLHRANNEMIDIEKLSGARELAALVAGFEKIRNECESQNNAQRMSNVLDNLHLQKACGQ
jgi:low affinity Fe/Cu permease